MNDLIGWIVVFELAFILIGIFISYWRSVSNTEAILRNQVVISQQLSSLEEHTQKVLAEHGSQILSEIRPISSHYRALQKAAEYRAAGL